MRKLVLLLTFNLIFSICFAQHQPHDSSKNSLQLDSSAIDEFKENIIDNIPTISLDENDFSEASSQNVSSLLTAGRDPFYNAATYNFGPARFGFPDIRLIFPPLT